MIVADERIEAMAQTMPTGHQPDRREPLERGPRRRLDQRVDADVAVVDTGISPVADLNVAGGYNCSTPIRRRGATTTATAPTSRARSAPSTTDIGVVGVAPGVRVWAVKILDDSGEGLLSWYVCGLDWIAAQRDPSNASRPLFEVGEHERRQVGQATTSIVA